jgi:murein DD-endopeptidase MepM/ murein hydrolase activator NlpD
MFLAAVAVVAGSLFSRGQIAAQDLTASESVLKSTNTTKTIVPTDRPRSDVVAYKVASGDTLSSLATKYNVSIETIKWANNLGDSDALTPNQSLNIPPVTGVVYQVKAGDNLDSVAKSYSADKQTIADFPFNYIDDSLSLRAGQTLFVPNGSIPAPVKKAPTYASRPIVNNFVIGSGLLSWPVPNHISQYFSWYHTGLDLANPYGTPIYAAAAGTVIDSKKQNYSFGWYCIVDIGGGYTVAYAHMSNLGCSLGEQVARGQYLGAVGTTGRATGPHLHLEVHLNGKPVDPLTLLK